MKSVFIATSTFAKHSNKPLDMLKENNIKYEINKTGKKLTEEELAKYLLKYDAVIAGTENYSSSLLKKLSNLKIISRLGVGTDNINLMKTEELNINVYKTKTTPALAVTELVLGLIINICRKISISNNNMKSNIWKKSMGELLSGKKLGIIGLGVIGKTLVRLVKGFNFDILAYDINKDQDFVNKNNITMCTLDDLLKKSDIISIHLNLSEDTINIINRNKLKLLKKNAIIINTSRGEVIDEEYLYILLKLNKIAGAGLDVFQNEPYEGPLAQLDNVILTPHIGSYAREIRIQMEIESVKNIIRGFNEI